jgi:hypothetical protein
MGKDLERGSRIPRITSKKVTHGPDGRVIGASFTTDETEKEVEERLGLNDPVKWPKKEVPDSHKQFHAGASYQEAGEEVRYELIPSAPVILTKSGGKRHPELVGAALTVVKLIGRGNPIDGGNFTYEVEDEHHIVTRLDDWEIQLDDNRIPQLEKPREE